MDPIPLGPVLFPLGISSLQTIYFENTLTYNIVSICSFIKSNGGECGTIPLGDHEGVDKEKAETRHSVNRPIEEVLTTELAGTNMPT